MWKHCSKLATLYNGEELLFLFLKERAKKKKERESLDKYLSSKIKGETQLYFKGHAKIPNILLGQVRGSVIRISGSFSCSHCCFADTKFSSFVSGKSLPPVILTLRTWAHGLLPSAPCIFPGRRQIAWKRRWRYFYRITVFPVNSPVPGTSGLFLYVSSHSHTCLPRVSQQHCEGGRNNNMLNTFTQERVRLTIFLLGVKHAANGLRI